MVPHLITALSGPINELEQRILACGDPAVLATWLQRAATLTNAEELLAG